MLMRQFRGFPVSVPCFLEVPDFVTCELRFITELQTRLRAGIQCGHNSQVRCGRCHGAFFLYELLADVAFGERVEGDGTADNSFCCPRFPSLGSSRSDRILIDSSASRTVTSSVRALSSCRSVLLFF